MMEVKDSKRKKDKYSDNEAANENSKEKRSKRRRSRSRTPKENRNENSRQKRKHSKSPTTNDAKHEKRSNAAPKETENKREAPIRKTKETDMLNTRTGGAYIPPARLRMMQAQITDKSSVAYQRLAWEALKKSIHGHINKINVGNIGIIIKQLLKENIVRGRGLLCRSIIQAQAASPTFTNVYAALVAAVNSRFPNIGELLLKRLVIQFKRGFKRNDKPTCISSASFIAHLVNQKVAHEILALELLTLLVESPTDDSVEVAIAFLKECGQKLTEVSSKGINAIFEMLRNILHEGQLDKRVQYMIEVMFQVWKDGFKDHPAVVEELELVPEEEQFTHLLMLDDATDSQDILNVFKFDDKYEENEQKYTNLSKEILGSDAESGEEGSDESGSEESEEDDDDEDGEKKDMTIIDKTETNLVALRRTIYLTINSSLDFEECAHKLMKMQLKPGQEIELCHMFLDCCAEQRTYEKFYGLLAQRFCNINRIYIGPFEEIFKDSYATAHRLDTNRLRNVSKFFAHLLFTDSISWEVLECVKLNEEDTTSSSRIYIKILFQELAEYMGLKKLNDRLKDPTLQQAFSGVFPRDNPKNTRFSINFFTSIGLGGLTDELREHLKQMPKNVPPPVTEINIDSESSSDSSSSSSSSSSSDDSSESDSSDSEVKKKKKTKNKSKEKSKKPQTPEPGEANQSNIRSERWGHDGFYDTYGQGAKRAGPKKSETSRPNEREYERNNRNTYNDTNGDYRNNRERKDGSRERESRQKYNDVRRGRDYEDETRRRGDDDDDDESRRRRYDGNEERHRTENEGESRRRREDRDETRRRRDYEDNGRQRKDYVEETRGRREHESGRRRDNKETSRRRDDKEETGRKQDSKDNKIRQRRDYEDGERRRDYENESRQKRDNEEETRRNREGQGESRRKRDNKDDERRRNSEDEASRKKGNGEESRHNREDKDKSGQRRDKTDEARRERNYDDKKTQKVMDGQAERKKKGYNEKTHSNDEEDNNSAGKKTKIRSDVHKTKEVINEKDKNKRRVSVDGEYDKPHNKYRSERKKKEIQNSEKREKRNETNSDTSSDSDSDTDSSSETDSSSDSESESDTGISKPRKDKKTSHKSSKKQKYEGNTDSEKKNCGGRYWDTFDVETRDSRPKKRRENSFEQRTPDRIEKDFNKKREQ